MAGISRKSYIAAAVCLALVTAALVYVYMSRIERAASAPVQVVTAAESIAPETLIKPEMLKTQKLPKSKVPPGAYTNTEPLVGKTVALTQIEQGAPIAQGMVGPAHRLSYRVPPFMRAVTVALDPIIGVGGFIKPGDRVDVVATFTVDKGSIAKTVLQDVELLATGSQLVAQEVEPETGKEAKSQAVPNATLAVMPSDAEKLILAEARGKLRLTLRGADDTSYTVSKGITSRALLGPVPPDVAERAEPSAAAPSTKVATTKKASQPVAGGPLPGTWVGGFGPPEPVAPIPPPVLGKTIQVIRGSQVEETVVPK